MISEKLKNIVNFTVYKLFCREILNFYYLNKLFVYDVVRENKNIFHEFIYYPKIINVFF